MYSESYLKSTNYKALVFIKANNYNKLVINWMKMYTSEDHVVAIRSEQDLTKRTGGCILGKYQLYGKRLRSRRRPKWKLPSPCGKQSHTPCAVPEKQQCDFISAGIWVAICLYSPKNLALRSKRQLHHVALGTFNFTDFSFYVNFSNCFFFFDV